MKNLLFLVIILVGILGCDQPGKVDLMEITTRYHQTYAERSDFQKFLSFYADTMVLEDIVFGERIEGREELARFFDWENPGFSLRDSVAIVVADQIIEGEKAVIQGYFTPFTWDGMDVEAMHFTTILEFNEAGKIIKHIDWINYPAYLIDYEKRKNSNLWISE